MAIEAQEVDPRKTFRYLIECEGLPVALVQSVSIPDAELGTVEHAPPGSATKQKTVGAWKFSNITLKKVMPANSSDTFFWDWMRQARDPETGQSIGAARYKRGLTIIDKGDNDQIIDKWECEGCFPVKDSHGERSSMQDAEAAIETVEISCDRYRRVTG
jgi:phage tail-like protein